MYKLNPEDSSFSRFSNGNIGATKLTVIEARKIVNTTRDLINPQFEAWYYKKLYELGVAKYLEYAEIARKGKSPKGLFSYWLKNS